MEFMCNLLSCDEGTGIFGIFMILLIAYPDFLYSDKALLTASIFYAFILNKLLVLGMNGKGPGFICYYYAFILIV